MLVSPFNYNVIACIIYSLHDGYTTRDQPDRRLMLMTEV